MIKKIQQDFSYYSHEFKDNYRKGVHRLRTILASRAQAQAFVSNAGGTAVVLGYEPETPDKNAQELYALLAASPYIDDAVQTFLGSIYEAGAESQDAMYSDSARCLEILHNPVMSRAAGAGTVSAGKWIATLAGQSCNLYRDMNAVAASDIAMTAVAASETAMAAVAASRVAMSAIIGNSTALNAVVTSSVAMAAVAASQTAMAAVASSQTAMAAIASSQTAMAAIASSQTARAAIEKSQVAKDAIAASDMATAKYAVGAAGLKPADYANMAAVAASQTAMAAIASSQTAMAAIIGNSTALNAVVSSSTAMAAIAASQTAMTAIASSQTAMTAVCSSALAFNAALKNSTARTQLAGSSYLQSNYDKLLSTVGNSTYFSQKFDNIDSGAKRAISGGNTDTTATANESVFLCKKIGAWSNGNSVTGTVAHLQTKTTAGSISTRAGGGQSTDDYTTGGVQAKYICIGGCTFTENGDAYCCGIFAFAK